METAQSVLCFACLKNSGFFRRCFIVPTKLCFICRIQIWSFVEFCQSQISLISWNLATILRVWKGFIMSGCPTGVVLKHQDVLYSCQMLFVSLCFKFTGIMWFFKKMLSMSVDSSRWQQLIILPRRRWGVYFLFKICIMFCHHLNFGLKSLPF